jgi:hypothetical protein
MVRLRKDLEKELTAFQKEFRKHLATFITGAFSFVAALFWRDAISEMIGTFIPPAEEWFFKLWIALGVTVISVLAIVVISKILRVEK